MLCVVRWGKVGSQKLKISHDLKFVGIFNCFNFVIVEISSVSSVSSVTEKTLGLSNPLSLYTINYFLQVLARALLARKIYVEMKVLYQKLFSHIDEEKMKNLEDNAK